MTRYRSLALSALIIWSAVLVGVGPTLVGPAEAQTDTYTQQFTTGPHKVAIDLSNVSTETTITVITDESPAGDNTAILEKTVGGAQPSAHFRNAGAYQEFTIEVSGADAKVEFSKGGVTSAWTPGSDGVFLGDTGGDSDFTYDLSERIGESVMPQIVQLDRTGLPSSTTVNTTGLDAQQVKQDLYQSGLNQQASAENYQTTVDNTLQHSETQALIIGKNAYIRALNNGSSKAAATNEANQAIANFYAVKQLQLINEWERSVLHYEYMVSVAKSESGISQDHHDTGSASGRFLHAEYLQNGTNEYYAWNDYQGDTSTTLLNGTTVSYNSYRILRKEGSGGTIGSGQVNVTTGRINPTGEASAGGRLVVENTSTGAQYVYMDPTEYSTRWTDIENQYQATTGEMETLINNTYDAYQAGEIDNSDLVDPYVLASERSAGDDFQGWAATQLTLLGQNSPENYDQMGSFNVTTKTGDSYRGILFSPENPASGQFAANQTYDPSAIGGTQYIVTSDRIRELNENFTVQNITTTDGERVQNVTIEKTVYKTSNLTELKQQYEDLAYRRAQIEAREQALKEAGGGGLFGGGSVSPIIAISVIGTLLLVVLLDN
ncbi:hypothetical protein NDI85_16365 [Halomicroarcula sp. S1AR25-4]|uniref:hypothetical protein n=1 Tax=Haloarcula sp. S1AR25-4 TaxID=2950538 RepID=UPI0028766BAD|nr:hypothetical protein [Halomicroarcula sp. S1AR25-4]MDS0279376.1 hypothetical protein [Halomicroarcula sp. S1AR25-4]